jgi:hypothetical protein
MKEKEMRGLVEKIDYSNDQTGFTVAKLKTTKDP